MTRDTIIVMGYLGKDRIGPQLKALMDELNPAERYQLANAFNRESSSTIADHNETAAVLMRWGIQQGWSVERRTANYSERFYHTDFMYAKQSMGILRWKGSLIMNRLGKRFEWDDQMGEVVSERPELIPYLLLLPADVSYLNELRKDNSRWVQTWCLPSDERYKTMASQCINLYDWCYHSVGSVETIKDIIMLASTFNEFDVENDYATSSSGSSAKEFYMEALREDDYDDACIRAWSMVLFGTLEFMSMESGDLFEYIESYAKSWSRREYWDRLADDVHHVVGLPDAVIYENALSGDYVYCPPIMKVRVHIEEF
jgi:hypothetical protein